jgi:hypothetical protein
MESRAEIKRIIRLNIQTLYDNSLAEYYLYHCEHVIDDMPNYYIVGLSKDKYRAVKDIKDATDLNTMSEVEALRTFHQIKAAIRPGLGETIEFLELKILTEFRSASFDPDVQRDFLRHEALSKLTADEIAALGITNYAVYDKVKYHNA